MKNKKYLKMRAEWLSKVLQFYKRINLDKEIKEIEISPHKFEIIETKKIEIMKKRAYLQFELEKSQPQGFTSYNRLLNKKNS